MSSTIKKDELNNELQKLTFLNLLGLHYTFKALTYFFNIFVTLGFCKKGFGYSLF